MYVAGCRLGFSNRSRAVCVCVVVVATVITTLLAEVDVVISVGVSGSVGDLAYVEVYVRSATSVVVAGCCHKHNFTLDVIDKCIFQDLLIDQALNVLSCGIVISTNNISNVIYLSLAFVKNDSLVLLIKLAEFLLCLAVKLADLIHVANSGACSGKYLYDANELGNEQEEKRKPTVWLVKEVFESK